MPIKPSDLPSYVPPQKLKAKTEQQIDSLIKTSWDARQSFAKIKADDLYSVQQTRPDWYSYEEMVDLFVKNYGEVWDIKANIDPLNPNVAMEYILTPQTAE